MGVAESCLRQKALVGAAATGRAGLGCFPKTQISQTGDKERHHPLQKGVRCEQVWRKCVWAEQNIFQRVQFLVQAVDDALPSPANLQA